MSTRPQLPPQPVIVNGDMSQATLTSLVTIVQKISMLSYQVSWAGSSPVGVISVQVSNDYALAGDGSVKTAGSWSSLTLASPANVSGNTGVGYIDVPETGAYAIRLLYTKTSGTGTLQATVCGKVS